MMGEKHGKSKKGARFNRSKIEKDLMTRLSRTVHDRLVVIMDDAKHDDPRAFWYWRRADTPELKKKAS